MNTPLVIAHSGFCGTVPNSLASIAEAAALGADGVEVDVQCSAEGTPILAHDRAVVAADGTEHSIPNVSAATIATGALLPRGARTPPPSLDEVVASCHARGLLVNLDIKDERAFPAVVQLLSDPHTRPQAVITGRTIEDLHELGRPVAAAGLLVNVSSNLVGAGASRYTLDQLLDRVVALGAQGINLQHSLVTGTIVAAAHRRFLAVTAWTVDQDNDIARVRRLGVDAITTNRPQAVIGGRHER